LIFGVTLIQGAMPDGRMFALDQQTLISIAIQLFNVCLLAVFLGRILYRPVQDYLRRRTDRIGGQLQDALDKMAEADRLKAQYEENLSRIEVRRTKVLEAAQLAANEKSRQIVGEAKEEAAAIKLRAEEAVLAEKQRLQEETRLHIIEISSLIAGRIVQKTIDSDMHNKLFEETIAELEEASWPI
jgi:F-type H+-transporting ATPase subunit b